MIKKLKINNLLLNFIRKNWAVLTLILVAVVAYNFLIFRDSKIIINDAVRYNGYQMYAIRDSLLNYGQLALWDQRLSSGMSWISHPGGPLLSPIIWPIILLIENVFIGTRIFILIHIIFAVLAFYFFARTIKLSKTTSVFISIAYITHQYAVLISANGWLEEVFGLTLIPLSTGLLWKAFTEKDIKHIILAIFVTAIHFFQNTYFIFHYNAIVLLWITFCLILKSLLQDIAAKKAYFKEFIKNIALTIFFWVGVIAFSAAKLLPLLEFRSISSRQALPLSTVETPDNVLPLSFLIDRVRNFLYPSTTPIFPSIMKTGNLIALVLVVLILIYALYKKRFKYLVFSGLLIIALWGHLANRAPIDLYGLFYKFLPGFNSNQFPFRFITIINFAFFSCLALSLDIFLKKSSNLFLKISGYFIGIFLIISGILYTTFTFNGITFPVVKNTNNSGSLLNTVAKIYQKEKPEGRVYSTFLSQENSITSVDSYLTKLPIVHHSYEPIVPTYQFGIVRQGLSTDPVELTKKRYKIFSVLNTRFQLQQKEFFEYKNCSLLDKSGETGSERGQSCDFLEKRLKPLILQKRGGLYIDDLVLPRITTIPNSILVISDDRFNDFSAFISKQILFNPLLEVDKTTVLSSDKVYLDDYSLDEISSFQAVLLVEPKIKNKKKTDMLISEYSKKGGKVIKLTSNWNHYNNLHQRSLSIFTDKPAWSYSESDREELGNVLKEIQSRKQSKSRIDIQKFSPEHSIFKVRVAERSILQFSDTYYPGWKAQINSKSAPIYMADGMVKAVVIPKAGVYKIEFKYQPDSLKIGALISILSMIVLIVFLYYNKKPNNLQKDG